MQPSGGLDYDQLRLKLAHLRGQLFGAGPVVGPRYTLGAGPHRRQLSRALKSFRKTRSLNHGLDRKSSDEMSHPRVERGDLVSNIAVRTNADRTFDRLVSYLSIRHYQKVSFLAD